MRLYGVDHTLLDDRHKKLDFFLHQPARTAFQNGRIGLTTAAVRIPPGSLP
jgi:hypothetical protein